MNNPLRWLALVALDEPVLPDENRVQTFMAQRFVEDGDAAIERATDGLLTCTLGDYTAAVTLVPRAIPWSQLEGPCETAWYWPNAAENLRKHEAHLLVTLVDEAGRPVEKSRRLTQLVAATAADSPSCGVFWGPGRLVHPTAAFIEQAVQMTPDDLPLFLWVDFRVEKSGSGAARLYTTGLEALGHVELEVVEFAGEPQQLLEYAYNVAHYLLTDRKSIEEGHTIGLTEQVQAVAHRTKSMFDDAMDVIQLEFVAAT